MSLQPDPKHGVPEETARIARSSFPKGNIYMAMHDELGSIYEDEEFADLFGVRGKPAEAPWRLALVTIMQFVEDLSDSQAADAVRGRVDWKYALELPLEEAGFDASVLCKFRRRLVAGSAEMRLFEKMLAKFAAKELLKGRGKQRSDSTHVLGAVRVLTRLECVGETLRHALNVLATVVPGWLQARVPTAWFDRYGKRLEMWRLPKEVAEREAWVKQVGADGYALMQWILEDLALAWVLEVPVIETLRQVWLQQFYLEGVLVQWREQKDLPPCGQQIVSPYDSEVRYGKKRDTDWVGYKVHLTETCDDDLPHLIVNVETTATTVDDATTTPVIHQHLDQRDLLPDPHLLDAGYMSAENIVYCQQEYQVDLIGPVLADNSWQARLGHGYDKAAFTIDWETQQATCPQGHTSRKWSVSHDQQGRPVITVAFDSADCVSCPAKASCTRAARRTLKLRPQPLHDALQQARARQETDDFKSLYKLRAGSEGTISQAVNGFSIRCSRYWGQAKTHLSNLATAAAINLVRWFAWFEKQSRRPTRVSRFAALDPAA